MPPLFLPEFLCLPLLTVFGCVFPPKSQQPQRAAIVVAAAAVALVSGIITGLSKKPGWPGVLMLTLKLALTDLLLLFCCEIYSEICSVMPAQ